ncbi:hypothetical protein FA95DRAFT_981325 [Auriscalpium vulgare]|uniref:Uncharacterized protein n=1 Tax=Auriscalpium vulgare TaxID=40419 RepID=A0ACB8R6Z1_9AGAM|nr:hypothetical protein FA95DRAFT_981325 [Auriscalpium vulgare]
MESADIALRWTRVGNFGRTGSTAHVASLRLPHLAIAPTLPALNARIWDGGRGRASECVGRHDKLEGSDMGDGADGVRCRAWRPWACALGRRGLAARDEDCGAGSVRTPPCIYPGNSARRRARSFSNPSARETVVSRVQIALFGQNTPFVQIRAEDDRSCSKPSASSQGAAATSAETTHSTVRSVRLATSPHRPRVHRRLHGPHIAVIRVLIDHVDATRHMTRVHDD